MRIGTGGRPGGEAPKEAGIGRAIGDIFQRAINGNQAGAKRNRRAGGLASGQGLAHALHEEAKEAHAQLLSLFEKGIFGGYFSRREEATQPQTRTQMHKKTERRLSWQNRCQASRR